MREQHQSVNRTVIKNDEFLRRGKGQVVRVTVRHAAGEYALPTRKLAEV